MNPNVIALKEKKKPKKWRTHLMRGLFFLNVISLAFDNWSAILFPQEQLDVLRGVAISFWASFSLLNVIGIRYPLQMAPILLLQLLYKSCWIIGIYLPAKSSGDVTTAIQEFFWICVTGIVLNLFIIPWGYVHQTFVKDFFRMKPKAH